MTKSKLKEILNDLPEKFSVDDLIDRIVLLQKIEVGLEHSKKGLTYSTAKAKLRLKKWLK